MAAWCSISFASASATPIYSMSSSYKRIYNITSSGELVEITNLIIPGNVTKIGDYAFYSCSYLQTIVIENGVIEIGKDAFNSCSYASSIVIPNTVTTIGARAFKYSNRDRSVTIGTNVTSIGSEAFAGGNGYSNYLTEVISLNTVAPTITNNTFQYAKTGGTLYVPAGSTGYNVWMGTGNYYLGKYNWTKVEQ